MNEGGIKYAQNKLDKISASAIKELDIFKDSDEKKSLISVLDFNIKRNI